MNPQGPKAHVVIVGGGFAGLTCARTLAKTSDVQITLIDKNNYHQFQPLLYQLATAAIGTDDIATSFRHSLRRHANVEVKMAEVTAADPKTCTVTTREGKSYQGEFLGIAGKLLWHGRCERKCVSTLFEIQEAQQLRSRILTVFEDSDREPKLAEQGALNFVIVGGGPTGVEMAGSLADMFSLTMTREYTDLAVKTRTSLSDRPWARSTGGLFRRGPGLCLTSAPKKGVKLRLGTGVKEVAPDHVVLSDGTSIQTRTVIWGVGYRPHLCRKVQGYRAGMADGLMYGPTSRLMASPVFTCWATSRIFQALITSLCRNWVRWRSSVGPGPRRIFWQRSRAKLELRFTITTRESWR